jgi:hypothetical protein
MTAKRDGGNRRAGWCGPVAADDIRNGRCDFPLWIPARNQGLVRSSLRLILFAAAGKPDFGYVVCAADCGA